MKRLTGLRQPIKDLEGNDREEQVLNGRGVPVLRAGEPIWRSKVAARIIGSQLHTAGSTPNHPQGWDAMLIDKLARLFYDAGDELDLEDADFEIAKSVIEDDTSLFPWAKAAALAVFENAKTAPKAPKK